MIHGGFINTFSLLYSFFLLILEEIKIKIFLGSLKVL